MKLCRNRIQILLEEGFLLCAPQRQRINNPNQDDKPSAWKLWNENRAMELMDALMEKPIPESEVLRCIQVSLLCVQQHPEDRPPIASVLLMLDSENSSLPQPKQPGFYTERFITENDSSSTGKTPYTATELTITMLQGRSGIWNGVRFNSQNWNSFTAFKANFTVNVDGVFYMYENGKNTTITRLFLDQYGLVQRYAWILWKDGRPLELMDVNLDTSYVSSELLRCMQVGLLCVQKAPVDRPTMSSVIFMLGNEGVTLPQPKEPGFFTEESSNHCTVEAHCCKANADKSKKQRRIIIAVTVYVASAVIILASISWFIIWKMRRNKSSRPDNQANISGVERERDDLELPLFDMATIEAATNNFSAANKIGADEARRRSLNWQKRLDIVIGIARGLLYLHRDSRLRSTDKPYHV
ncbi:g-type lectin s-receptor-like serine/threonine-protein kinase sd1-13 [Quercus suber]|uniref:G-type lectin s-receptor-like serine/threonine-protein kinase sd1-13 n=1 Tax=Quercus suber TaxID=58331 RepID=A0AAW0KL90_QUESU